MMTTRSLGMLVSVSSMLHYVSAALLVVALWVLVTGLWPPREEFRDQIGATAK